MLWIILINTTQNCQQMVVLLSRFITKQNKGNKMKPIIIVKPLGCMKYVNGQMKEVYEENISEIGNTRQQRIVDFHNLFQKNIEVVNHDGVYNTLVDGKLYDSYEVKSWLDDTTPNFIVSYGNNFHTFDKLNDVRYFLSETSLGWTDREIIIWCQNHKDFEYVKLLVDENKLY